MIVTEKEIRERLDRHTSNVHRQHFLYRAHKRLEPTSLEAVIAKDRTKAIACYNADTIDLIMMIDDPLTAKVVNSVYIEGKGVTRTACDLNWSIPWVYRRLVNGIKEIYEKSQH